MLIPNSPKKWYILTQCPQILIWSYAVLVVGVCLFQGHTYWRMNKIALAWTASSKTYYFTLKYEDLQRTNPEYLEDETELGTGVYDTGSGKIHHQNKIAERVDIIF